MAQTINRFQPFFLSTPLNVSHRVTVEFEEEVARFTGAPYAVAVSSCTDALELCLARLMPKGMVVSIPRRTYVSVPQVIIKNGGLVRFDGEWMGCHYQLKPLPVYDCAKVFAREMYCGGYQCISFHVAKVLGDSQGGAILCDDEEDAKWFKRARYDGRGLGPIKDDKDIFIGFHCYLSPDVAARLLLRMKAVTFAGGFQVPRLEEEYSDLSQLECFKPYVDRAV